MNLYTKSGHSYQLATDDQILTVARDVATRYVRETGMALTSPAAARDLLTVRFAGLQHEVFSVLYLDSRHRLLACEDLFRGTIDGCAVHPREVVKAALKHNAAAVILAHNHPSGLAEPSQADEMITIRLRDALALIDIRVLDHLVIGGMNVTSLAERGVL